MYEKFAFLRFRQCDILADVKYGEAIKEVGNELNIESLTLPYATIFTQDCDLQQDFDNRANSERNQNGYLLNVLICPAYLTETFKVGEQLIELDLKMNPFNTKDIKKIEAGLLERYHFLQEDPKLGIPSLVIDFKHYFTIDTKRLYSHDSSNVYLASLATPYRERLSQRFCNYLSRIGLPDKNTAAI